MELEDNKKYFELDHSAIACCAEIHYKNLEFINEKVDFEN